MHTLFSLKSSSDIRSSHIGNFNYLDNKNLFLVPLFCAEKVSVILKWCFVSEASRCSTLRSCASQSGQYCGHKRNWVCILPLVCSLQSVFYPQSLLYLQSAVCSLYLPSVCTLPPVCSLQSEVCSLHFTLTNIKVKSWPHKKETVDHIKSKLGHRNTKGILTGLAPHICGCFLRICRKIWHFLILWDSKG